MTKQILANYVFENVKNGQQKLSIFMFSQREFCLKILVLLSNDCTFSKILQFSNLSYSKSFLNFETQSAWNEKMFRK